MRLTITTLTDEIFTFEVSDDMDLENFRALCEVETGIPAIEIVVFWNGRPLHNDKSTLFELGIRDGDVLLLQRVQGTRGQPATSRQMTSSGSSAAGGTPMIDFSQIMVPGSVDPTMPIERTQQPASLEDPAVLRDMLLASPHDVAMLKERNSPLADALLSGSLEKFTEVLNKQREEKAERERDRIRLLSADPFDTNAQRLIAEEIRLKNVEHNMETAIEHSPESFGQVVMLYINCRVNGHAVKAFVDSGAQMTIMSQACAERCNIMRLVDKRWAGIAKGVGTQKIIGRVHLCQIQIGSIFLQTSFSILEDQPMDMLLGLDMLKRHQCVIDLRHNVLNIGDTTTPFLSESELPEYARLNQPATDEDIEMAEAVERSVADNRQQARHVASSSGASSSRAAAPQRPGHVLPETDIQRLVEMGFGREQVIEALTSSGGNIDQALASLFAKSFQMP